MTTYDTIFAHALEIMMIIFIGMTLCDYGIHLILNLNRELKAEKRKEGRIVKQSKADS